MEVKQYINEVWKPVIGYYGLYEVSNMGRVRSLKRNTAREKIIKQYLKGSGYYQVCLYKDGVGKYFMVHRLVATAFIPNPLNLPQVNHKDEDKTNNVWTNLEWVTAKYNSNYGTRTQRIIPQISGENHYMYGKHLSEERKKQISDDQKEPVLMLTKHFIYLHEWPSAKDAADAIGVASTNIIACCNGRLKTVLGFKWKKKRVTV